MAAWLAEQPVPLAVDYHNITPAEYFDRWQPQAAQVARAARAEMRKLASSTAYGLADSTCNATELADEGYPDTAVVPILLDFADYDAAPDNLTFPQLLAQYRSADVFVSLSEHEGFCVPLVEAMHFGVPTVAFASTAVPETVGDATLLLPDKDPLDVAVAVQRVLSDDVVRK